MIASEILGNSRCWLRYLWAAFLSLSGCIWWAKHSLRKQGAVLVLMLHRVLDDVGFRETNSTADIVVREKTFRELTTYIAQSYQVVPLEQAEPGKMTDRLRLVLTFDDGWSDNYLRVFPRAKELKLPFTVFVCSGVLGEEMPFWTEQTAQLMKRLRPAPNAKAIDGMIEALKLQAPAQRLAWLNELREKVGTTDLGSHLDRLLSLPEILDMDKAGVSFGSHTHTHQILTTLPLEAGRQEVEVSKAQLEAALGKPCHTFAYPNGSWSPEVHNAVEHAGFRLAVTTQAGPWTRASDPMAIPRINISEENVTGVTGRFSALMFDYHAFWKAWRARRKRPVPTGVCPVPAPTPGSHQKAAAA
jgi:peptidoglycan/xylan/chitin deacetylase (PgdA/CDA1 family)